MCACVQYIGNWMFDGQVIVSAAVAKHVSHTLMWHAKFYWASGTFSTELVYQLHLCLFLSFSPHPPSVLYFVMSFSASGRSTSPEADTQGNHNSSKVGVATNPVSTYTSAHGGHEHYERIECTYIGSCEVSHGMGMETLNEAVDRLSPMTHRWLDVNVDVATSNIRISDIAVRTFLLSVFPSVLFSHWNTGLVLLLSCESLVVSCLVTRVCTRLCMHFNP